MKKLVIDIETVGVPWEDLDSYVREYLIKGLSDGDAEETRRAGGLSPFRGRIIAIGVINIEDGRSCAMYEVPGQTQLLNETAGQRTSIFGTTNSRQFKFNLDLACKVFGVETSKGEGLDGRSVETWYRAGRHREIADYCLDDVRATCELYEKIAPSLLMFNKEFREAEERAARMRRQSELPLAPSNESLFIE